MQDLLTSRLTREEFRAVARQKGWKFKMLAERWGLTPEWISMISRDERRDLRFDDALLGLPDLRHPARSLRLRARQIDSAVASDAARARTGGERAPGPGYRYRGYLSTGVIVTVTSTFGTMAEEGERGIVFQVIDAGQQEAYGVVFENGACDWFSPSLVDAHLATTGLVAAGSAQYRYRDRSTLQEDFDASRFQFWPALPGPR